MSDLSESFWVRFFACGFLILSAYSIVLGPPTGYPQGQVIVIPEGATIRATAQILKEKKAVAWPALFSALVRFSTNSVNAGSYILSQKQNVFALAYRFAHGETNLSAIKVTFPEGTTVREMGDILKNSLGNFDSQTFVKLAKPSEGYLFPDTYFFMPGITPEAVIAQMKDTFARRTAPIQAGILSFGKPESDIIIMASILEKEARQSGTRRIVAGILWKRLSLGMPLQVDAAFGYIFGKDTYSPSASDLKVGSPYNTYKYKGLPPGPIGNPGIETIEDAVTSIKTPYLYYVTDKEGNIYYAQTFAEHLLNKARAQR